MFRVVLFYFICGGLLSLLGRISNDERVLIATLFIVFFSPIIWVLVKDTFFSKGSSKRDGVKEKKTEDNHNKEENSHSVSFDPAKLAPYEYEKYVAKYLLEQGYQSAEVTQQSSDYGIDIIAVNSDGWRIAVQCKRYQGSVGVSAVQEAIAGKEYYGCDLAAVYTTGTYTEQAKIMARKTHVKLYVLDKNGLQFVN